MDQVDRESMWAALRVATKSPDPSTQNGAVLVRYKEIVAFGFNEFPEGVQYTPERWERPAKYQYIEHAERSVIYSAARNGIYTNGTVMYCPWFACCECARAIVRAGIIEVVGLQPKESGADERWAASVEVGMQILKEGGVKTRFIKGRFGIDLFRDGKLTKF